MKVVHIAQSVKGGIATYLSEILQDQISRFGKDNVVIVIPRGSRGEIALSDCVRIFEFDNVSRSPKSLFLASLEIVKFIADLSPDIIHLHSTFAGLIRIPLFFNRKFKIVYCSHGWAFSQDVGIAKKIVYGLIERVLHFRTDACVNISENDSREAKKFFISGRNVFTVFNGISNISEFSEFNRNKLKSNADLRIVFVGRFDRQKGVDILVRVFEKIKNKNAELLLIGAPVVDSGNQLVTSDNRIKFLGWLRRDQVMTYLADAHAVVIPSRWEGFGLIAIEAMRSGVAVICSNVGELPTIVADGKSGFVFSSEKQLQEILESTTVSQLVEMGLVGRGIFLNKYISSHMNNKLADLYGYIVDQNESSN